MRIDATGLLRIFLPLLFLLAPVISSAAESPSGMPADSLFKLSKAILQHGDTTGAITTLDKVLDADSDHWEARLARGRLYLAAGEKNRARAEFRHVLGSKIDRLRSKAWIGLGDIVASVPFKKWDAIIKEYLFAIKADPTNLEAYHRRAEVAFELGDLKGDGDPKGFRIASEMLLHLICIEPTYKESYPTWRDRILDKYNKEKLSAAECLESYVESHPDYAHWLLDAAGYRYETDQIDAALAALDRLETAEPGFKPADRHLLRARCLVELDDTSGFEDAYRRSLEAAELEGDFERLAVDAQAIFRPEEQLKADSLKSARQWARFFRTFWGRRDPDPLTRRNERLFDHYKRLREAQKKYSLNDPYSKALRSRDFYRRDALFSGAAGMSYDYDPDLFFNRYPELALQQRGLLYVRHGPPDLISRPITGDLSSGILHEEVWYYGGTFFPFRESKWGSSIGDYAFIPLSVNGAGNMTRAMETESFAEPLPTLEQNCYAVDFMAPDGWTEFETYQSLAVDEVELASPPGVSLAVFDNGWRELVRDSRAAVRVEDGERELWMGVNSVKVKPGPRIFAARMEVPGRRVLKRRDIALKSYRRGRIDLSGIVLGIPLPPSGGAHSRLGVELLPRPSLEYAVGEIMTVYLEIYGLRRGDSGQRKYTESVTVTRVGGDEGVLSAIWKLFSGGEKRASSLTLTFKREPVISGETIPETFIVDTSLLLPGDYRMKIEIIDQASQQNRQIGCFFRLD
ncbi:MAG: tetratricopeptide repeat protein [Candidatus Glassbacteria bacterium]|nr:tetratricopeptide repeat protein [Candidatus Glassbacteria bacterium]